MRERAGIPPKLLVVALAIGLVTALLIISYGVAQQHTYQRQTNEQSAENARHTQHFIEQACAGLSALEKYNCSLDAHRKQRENERSEQDSASQQKEALWTSLAASAAIVGALLSAVGIWLIFSTFVQNRRTADAAQDANRPWVEGEKPTNVELTLTASGIRLSAEVAVINHGNSPATNVLVRAILVVRAARNPTQIIPISGIELSLDDWEVQHRERGKIAYRAKPTKCVVVDELPASEIETAEGDEIRLCQYFVVVGISYRFGGKRGRTVNAYLMKLTDQSPELLPPYSIAPNETRRVRNAQVNLTDILEGYAI